MRASTKAVPTLGWPAKGISALGVKMRTWAVCAGSFGGSTKVVSARLNSAAMACICSVVRPSASSTTARGLPPNLRSVKTSTVWNERFMLPNLPRRAKLARMTNAHASPQISYDHGVSAKKLIGATIGAFFDRQVENYREREALVVKHQNVRWTLGRARPAGRRSRRRPDDARAWSAATGSASGRPTRRNGRWRSSPPPRRGSCWSTSTRPTGGASSSTR